MCEKQTEALPVQATPLAVESELTKLTAYIASFNSQIRLAKNLAQILLAIFGPKSKNLVKGFLRNGWSINDLYWLNQWDHAWHKNPARIFRMEKTLIASGMSPETARCMLIERPNLLDMDPQELATNTAAMREMGYTDIQLFNLSRYYPKYFRMTPEAFKEAYAMAQSQGEGILWNPKISKSAAETHTLTKPTDELSTPVEQEVHQTLAEASPMETEPARETTTEAEVVPMAETASLADTLPADDDESSQSKVSPPVVRVVKRSIIHPLQIPLPPPLPQFVTDVSAKREPPPEPYVSENDSLKNWNLLIQMILECAFPDKWERVWKKFQKENTWVISKYGETQILSQLYEWVSFGSSMSVKDPRALFFASILLNRDLTSKRKKRRLGTARPDLSSILKLEEEVVYFRMYTCRRILQREPMRWPEGLCYPWEQVLPFAPPRPLNFSIIPPPLTDEKLWIAKRDELRFRANLVRDHGWRPERKPFLLMLQEPTRKRFLKRFNRYLKLNGDGKEAEPKLRYNKQVVSPFCPMS